MTRRISLIVGIAVAALTVAVPTALAEGRLAGSIEPGDVVVGTYRDAHERAGASVNQGEPQWLKALAARSEGLNRKYGLGEFAGTSQAQSPELAALQARSIGLNRMYGLGEFASGNGYRDAHERSNPPVGRMPVSLATSSNDIEWPQLGVGLGIGIILVLGFALVIRATHTRPFAH
jgi:hypothetical protein